MKRSNHTSNNTQDDKLRIGFIHPDLGLGGAERLIVDAAMALKSKGHIVNVFTAYHDKERAFEETVNGNLNVYMYGNWFPRTILGKFHILCTIIRMLITTICIWLFHNNLKRNGSGSGSSLAFDVFIVDQVSVHIPLIRLLFPKAKIVFYCHFPDKLLVQNRGNLLKRLYRVPFDYLEQLTTGMSDQVLVNSQFTLNVYKGAFPSLAVRQEKIGKLPIVVYPSINTHAYDQYTEDDKSKLLKDEMAGRTVITSVNRFERKKNIGLAVHAFAKLIESKGNEQHNLLLVLAGGYDDRVEENVQHLNELKYLVDKLNIGQYTLFKPSFTNSERYILFHNSTIIAYTPENEHFGIVPVEAMYCERCLVAVNSGGPLESVEHNVTGLLCDSNPDAFASALQKFLDCSEKERIEYGKRAKERVERMFTLNALANSLHNVCLNAVKQR